MSDPSGKLLTVEISALLPALIDSGERLAAAADEAGLDQPVPTCPDWLVRDLLLHVGAVHHWAASYLRERIQERRPFDVPERDRFDDTELVPWYRKSHRALVDTIESAPADVACWTFLPAPSPLEFWVRRQAHETTIHRVDAECAAGTVTPIPGDVATDGIDELLTGFVIRPRGKLRSEQPRTLGVHTTDTDAHWLLKISQEPVITERVDAPAGTTLSGRAADVYLALWNRLPLRDLEIGGDEQLVRDWPAAVRVR